MRSFSFIILLLSFSAIVFAGPSGKMKETPPKEVKETTTSDGRSEPQRNPDKKPDKVPQCREKEITEDDPTDLWIVDDETHKSDTENNEKPVDTQTDEWGECEVIK